MGVNLFQYKTRCTIKHIMELTVRIVSVSELKESTFTTRQGETKLLSKRIFISNDGYDVTLNNLTPLV